MTLRVLLLGIEEPTIQGLDVRCEKTNWNLLFPFQKYDMLVVDTASIRSQNARIAASAQTDFSEFVENGGVLVCLSSTPRKPGGYSIYSWLNSVLDWKVEESKASTTSLKIGPGSFEAFFRNQATNISVQSVFSLKGQAEVLARTGQNKVVAFSMDVKGGTVFCLPEFEDTQLFIQSWLESWSKRRPLWVDGFRYGVKNQLTTNLKMIGQLERLLYTSDNDLKKAVIVAFRLLGFDAKDAGPGTVQDIDITYSPAGFVGIVEVKGLKQAADRDDMRALLDYFRKEVSRQPQLKGIFVVNHYRETEPQRKGEPYTPAALELAKREGFCLLTTTNLYSSLEKVLEDKSSADLLRERIMIGVGLIKV